MEDEYWDEDLITCHNCGKTQSSARRTCVECGEDLGNLDTAILGLFKPLVYPIWIAIEPILNPILNYILRPILKYVIVPSFRYLLLPLYTLGTFSWGLSNVMTGLSAGELFTVTMNILVIVTGLLAVIVYLRVPEPFKSALG